MEAYNSTDIKTNVGLMLLKSLIRSNSLSFMENNLKEVKERRENEKVEVLDVTIF